MSEGLQWVQRARQSRDPAEADGFAQRAILAEPARPDGYVVRGQLALHRRDIPAAAHHLRVAFARGARDAFTRDVLATCLAAVGQGPFAAKMRVGTTDPGLLATVQAGAEASVAAIRETLSRPLPAPDQPGLLPGEGPPAVSRTQPPSAQPPSARPPSARPESVPPAGRSLSAGPAGLSQPPGVIRPTRPTTANITLGPATVEEAPPARVTGTLFRQARQTTTHLGAGAPMGPAPTRAPQLVRRGEARPSWLEATPEFEKADVDEAPLAIEDPLEVAGSDMPDVAVRFDAGGVELAVDPGPLTFAAVSPVTGALMDASALAQDQRGSVMPDLGAPMDPLEARGLFLGLVDDERLEFAVRLPGPVLTREGTAPRRLAAQVGLALSGDQLLVRDADRPDLPIQRLPLAGFDRIDLVAEGQQISFFFADGRGLHMDLRSLRERALMVAVSLVDTLVERIHGLEAG